MLAASAAAFLARRWVRRTSLRAVHRFGVKLDRYKLADRAEVKAALAADPEIHAAIRAHAAEHGLPEPAVTRRVEEYIEEIVPFFRILTYYKLGYNLARLTIGLFYKATIEYEDRAALERVPKGDVVVYVMNHRSNADYVLAAYMLARVASISYAVGEWARTWPLEYLFKSFGSYFIRRRYREALYHTVLERYVQLITRHGVTQGIFPEGGLTRDGALRPAKAGLIDYMVRTLRDPAFTRDIWFVPVGINYDRVLEDRSLIRERIVGGKPPGRLRQLGGVVHYLFWNTLRLLSGRFRRYGRAAVTFGTPVSVRAWLRGRPEGILDLPRPERLGHVQQLADDILVKIGEVVPVTPVPLAAAALLSFGASVVPLPQVLDRMDALRDQLDDLDARQVRRELPVAEVWDRAWRMLRMRRLVVLDGGNAVILPRQRPLLEYYANSIRHHLPAEGAIAFSPARESDPTLPRLATREEMDIGTQELPAQRRR